MSTSPSEPMLSPIVVTGASGALGAAVVTELLKRGHRVAALVSPRGAKEGAAAGESAEAALTIPMDLTSRGAWASAIARVSAELGPPEGAVLAAGGWRGGAPFHAERDEAAWDAMFASNLDTARWSLRALLPGMVERGRGSVVVVGSRPAVRPEMGAGASAYTASKSALVGLAQVVAAEVVERGVRVNAVLPSTIDTPANRAAMPGADASKWVPLGSLASVIAFLLSPGARDVSGAAIPVYGRA